MKFMHNYKCVNAASSQFCDKITLVKYFHPPSTKVPQSNACNRFTLTDVHYLA